MENVLFETKPQTKIASAFYNLELPSDFSNFVKPHSFTSPKFPSIIKRV
jgi:hypothetical protein